MIPVHVRPKNDASNGVLKKGRGAQHAAETKNKSERREVGKNKGRKEGRGKDQKEGEMLYYHSTQLVNFAFSFSLYVRSTDLRAVSMTCDLRAEQRKRGSGEIRAKERTADTGRDVSRSWRARCFNGDREFLSFGSCPTRPRARARTAVPAMRVPSTRGARHPPPG